jgi:Tfp pilus assembly protein PilV
MNKITLLAIAVTGVISSAAFAQENTIPFENGDAILISPNGTVQKSTTRISAADHEAALARNGKELSRGTMIYKHEGKLYSSSCFGSYIGGWEQGYPATENDC